MNEQQKPCPHGVVSRRHCMQCLADALRYEEGFLQHFREALPKPETIGDIVCNAMLEAWAEAQAQEDTGTP